MEVSRAQVHELLERAGLRQVPPAVLIAAAGVLLAAVVFAALRWMPGSGSSTADEATLPIENAHEGPQGVSEAPGHAEGRTKSEASVSRDASSTLFVHVAGEVEHPDVYELPAGARVAEAVAAAGGLTRDAEASAINLARKLNDGEQILVPDKEHAQVTAGVAAAPSGGGAQPQAAGSAPVDINSAGVAELDTLPGVGPSTAQKILADREANGPFASVDDLGRVSGIGPKRLEQLKPLVRVE